jgi:hypothetical protein
MIPPLICEKLFLKECDAKRKLSFIKNISKQGGVQGVSTCGAPQLDATQWHLGT